MQDATVFGNPLMFEACKNHRALVFLHCLVVWIV